MNYTQLARALNIEVSSAQRRAEVAIQRGYLVNHQDRDRRPAQLIRSTDPLPDGGDLLPPVHELLEVCRRFASANANPKNAAGSGLEEQFARWRRSDSDAAPTEASG